MYFFIAHTNWGLWYVTLREQRDHKIQF
jgi:hypothetical protein